MKFAVWPLSGAAVSLACLSRADDATVPTGDLTWTGASAIGPIIRAILDGPFGAEAVVVEGLPS